jgi:hypothetical protein
VGSVATLFYPGAMACAAHSTSVLTTTGLPAIKALKIRFLPQPSVDKYRRPPGSRSKVT